MKDPMRFENPQRIEEIDIKNSLIKARIKEGDVLCDYGSGTGIIAVEAASMTKNKVYALDMNDEMIALTKEKIDLLDINNIELIKVQKDEIKLDYDSVDIFYMITVFHHINDIPTFIHNVKRVLKRNGRILVIDFHKTESPMGPPASHRMSANEIISYFQHQNITCVLKESLGENLYLLVFE